MFIAKRVARMVKNARLMHITEKTGSSGACCCRFFAVGGGGASVCFRLTIQAGTTLVTNETAMFIAKRVPRMVQCARLKHIAEKNGSSGTCSCNYLAV